MDELTWVDATEQAALVRNGVLRPIDLVDAAIERIERLDPAVNAVVIRRFDEARRDARGDLPDGPFRGVPILLKDHAPSRGDPWHAGSRAVKSAGYVATEDAYVVRRLRRAGFVILGRTNVPELCSWPSTEPLAYGPTRNPWDLSRSAGGSSGGSAAAVACGMTPVASGSDGGGSVRLPAGACGVVGVKPSRGRVSCGPREGHHWAGLSTDGVLARTVRDAAAVLAVMAGHETGDPYGVAGDPAPVRPLTPASMPDRSSTALRVGVCLRPPNGERGDDVCAAAVQAVATVLESLGHAVDERWPDALGDTSYARSSRVVVATNVAAGIAAWESRIGRSIADDELEAVNRMYREWSRSVSATDYIAAERELHAYGRRLATWWEDDGNDVLVTPVLSVRTPPLGWFDVPDRSGTWKAMFNYLGPFNISGQPALAIPALWTDDGIPVGVQLVGRVGREDLLLWLGAQLEEALGWTDHRPPVVNAD
ncbi:MAG TPA: amidase [Acidimicrobiales bacterium]